MRTRPFFGGAVQVPCDHALRAALVEIILKEPVVCPIDKQLVICQYTPLVMNVTNKMWHNGFGHFWGQVEDLFQEGVIGLIRAVEGWNPDRGTKFVTYAFTCIYRHVQSVTNAGDGIIHVPHDVTYCQLDELDEKFTRAISLAYKQARSGVKSLSHDCDNYQPCDERWSETEFKESLEEVQTALRSLREREIDIIKRRIGLDGEEETLLSISETHDISKERVRQVEANALAKLKNWLMERDPDEYVTQVARSKMFTTNLFPHAIDGTADQVAKEPEEVPA